MPATAETQGHAAATNQLLLSARIAQTESLRYTPAGLPALNLELAHESVVVQAGSQRQVSLSLKAIAFGTQAETLARQSIGSQGEFSGFLASTVRSKSPVFQIQAFRPEPH
jgi:primosomal replication protein N